MNLFQLIIKKINIFCSTLFLSFSFITTAYAIDIRVWDLNRDGQDRFYETLAEDFKKINPDVNVILEVFENEAYKTQIQVALNGNDGPDVFFNWFGEDSARLARAGLALDLTPYANVEGGYGNYISKAWQNTAAVDGKIFGIPNQAVAKYFYYDPSFFSANNLQVPSTFDDLLNLCQDIRAIDSSIVPWPLGNSERWKLNHVITMMNQRVVGEDNTVADYSLAASEGDLFTNPAYVEALQKVLDLQDAECFQEAPNATSPELTRSMFSSQISPMIYCGTWCGNIFNNEGFSEFSYFRFPEVVGGAGSAGTGFLVASGMQVSSKTEHPDIAAAVASFMLSDDMALLSADAMGYITPNPKKIDQMSNSTHWFNFYANDIADRTGHVNVLDVLLEANVSNAYLDMGTEILNRTKTPQEAMDFIRQVALEAKAAM